jgi:hypothetical protein
MSFNSENVPYSSSGYRFVFERTKSNRSFCGVCKEIIEKDLIRL